MEQIDFTTALGRLLRDGALRDAFHSAPLSAIQSLNVFEAECPSLLNLNPVDLEFQAQILLRKRFEAVARLLPQTCSNLGVSAWPAFAEYARDYWPEGQLNPSYDAQSFADRLLSRGEPVCIAERNRLRFALGGKRAAL